MSKVTVSTALYRDHHAGVGQLVGRIEALLASRTVEADPAALIATVRELFGTFAVHLSLEDSALYPRLLAHPGSVAKFAGRRRNGWRLDGAKPCRTSKVATSRVKSCSGQCAGIAGMASAIATSSR